MKDKKLKIFIAICTIPALFCFTLFMLYPILKGLVLSFYSTSGLSDSSTFIGLENFKYLLSDEAFWQSFRNNLFLLVVFPTITLLLSIFLAIALSQSKLREKNFYRIILFFPNVLSMVVIGVLFTNIYDTSNGILNKFLDIINMPFLKHSWLGDSNVVLWALVLTMIWQAVGYYMVIYMAGLDSIPDSLYEYAYLEGASSWQKFTQITLPLVWEVIRITLAFYITGVFNLSFLFVQVMTNGGPDGHSEVLLTYMYRQAFTNSNYGYAMTIGSFIFIFSILLSLILNKITKKEIIQF